MEFEDYKSALEEKLGEIISTSEEIVGVYYSRPMEST